MNWKEPAWVDRAVVKLLADLGRGLGVTVTAEGVEHDDQRTALSGLGVDHAQGYHIARPGEPFPIINW